MSGIMKRFTGLFIALISFLSGVGADTTAVEATIQQLNATLPVSNQDEYQIQSVSLTDGSLLIKMELKDVMAQYFGTFKENAERARNHWLLAIHRLGPVWERLLEECADSDIPLTLFVYVAGEGDFTLTFTTADIRKMLDFHHQHFG